jgi:hypothetical protein
MLIRFLADEVDVSLRSTLVFLAHVWWFSMPPRAALHLLAVLEYQNFVSLFAPQVGILFLAQRKS